MRPALLALAVALAACASDPAPADAPADPVADAPAAPAGPDTLSIAAADSALAARPEAPLRVEGACPFEGCSYGTWTTTAETTVYAGPSAGASSVSVPAGTVLNADRGFVLLTRLGVTVADRATDLYLGSGDTAPLAAGDTLLVMDSEGEGSFRAWSGGRLGFTGVDGFYAPEGQSPPLREVSPPEAQWWAHVTMDDGREGWLWMDETPPVDGADAFG